MNLILNFASLQNISFTSYNQRETWIWNLIVMNLSLTLKTWARIDTPGANKLNWLGCLSISLHRDAGWFMRAMMLAYVHNYAERFIFFNKQDNNCRKINRKKNQYFLVKEIIFVENYIAFVISFQNEIIYFEWCSFHSWKS